MSRPAETTEDDDPIVEAMRNAPIGEPFTPEQLAELDQDMADLAAGRLVMVPHEQVHAWLEARLREEAEVAAE